MPQQFIDPYSTIMYHLRWAVRVQEDGCWIFTGGWSAGRYGRLNRNGKSLQAHRYAWELINGPIPPGMVILHKCDVPRCVNPNHLLLGTQQDNVSDMDTKGRRAPKHGEYNGRAILKSEDVIAIRAAVDKSIDELATQFNVRKDVIRFIVTRRTWRHL